VAGGLQSWHKTGGISQNVSWLISKLANITNPEWHSPQVGENEGMGGGGMRLKYRQRKLALVAQPISIPFCSVQKIMPPKSVMQPCLKVHRT
jgi:hypothetical protein